MLDISSASAVVVAIGVIVGVIFAVLELRDLVKTRQTSLLGYIILGLARNIEKHGREC